MTYQYVQRDVAEGLLNNTYFQQPFYWDLNSEQEAHKQEQKDLHWNRAKCHLLYDQESFRFERLSYKKALKKIRFYEVNSEERRESIDDMWRTVVIERMKFV
jgi:hypothetical protein